MENEELIKLKKDLKNTKLSLKILLILIAVLWIIVFVHDTKNPSDYKDEAYEESADSIYLCLFAGVVIFGISFGISINNLKKKIYVLEVQEAKKKEANEKWEQEQKNDNAIKFYKKCLERNITLENMSDLKLIAKNYDVYGDEDSKEAYLLGKKLCANLVVEKLNEKKKEELKIQEKQKKDTTLVGHEKYIEDALKKLKEKESYLKATNAMGDVLISQSNYKAQKSDSAILGGLASGIAGRTAGLYTAVDTEIKNAKAEAEAARIRNNAKDMLSQLPGLSSGFSSEAYKWREIVQKVKDKLIDDSNQEEKFKAIDISQLKLQISDTGNVHVIGDMSVKGSFEILGKKACLDGSVKVIVKDQGNNVVAVGYYAAPGRNDISLYHIGFEKASKIDVMCLSRVTKIVESDVPNLKIEIEPIALWTIESDFC